MGRFLGSLENLEKAEDGEQTETPSGMTPEARERALKIIILVTKLSLAGAPMESEKELQTALVVPDLNPVLQQSDSQFYFILFVAVILFAGFLIGACVMGIFMWHRVEKLTVVRHKGSLMNVPAFLWRVKERGEEGKNQRQRGQPARPAWLSSAAVGSAAGTGSTAAGSAAGADSTAAGSAAGADSTAAGCAAGADPRAAGCAARSSAAAEET